MQEWHITTLGPEGSKYEKVPFHWVMEFPDDYPATAPKAYFPIKFSRGSHGGAMDTDSKGRQEICTNIFSNYDRFSVNSIYIFIYTTFIRWCINTT